ncbi:Mfa1 family fimbria major subunit [Alistipes senegalensis]|uniref:Mfa1 family fimbria major subunit n=1 Tax=Alistipes senegalensis JC50 TaxID=1033732 RepID=A0ABY5V4E1_9BACT|nr:Mfa1 family fimbria major subunit [Alistipes senegalensis]UEA87923.1 Mfa1 family fimbria major subunit [Alistipes senegalensis]UWN64487.1 Mfa1 family fimbria major subunit [Alistipes senegalensis JC50]
MKTKSIIAGMLSTMLLAVGCNKEDGGNRVTPEAGVKTYASFSVSLLNQSTRAASTDPNAVETETKISDLHIYIFNGGVLETKGKITLNTDNKGTTALATTTGTKTIYAVANYNNAQGAIGSLQSDFEKQLIAATDIAEENGFFMAGKTEATLTERTEDEAKQDANLIKISVARGAAKVQMQFGTNVPVKPVVNASVADAKFTLAQQNSQMYLAKLIVEGFSPKGKTAEQTDADADGTYDHLMKLPTTDDELKWINAGTTYQNTYATSKYLAENVNENPTTGNTSYVLVSLQVTPQATADATGNVTQTALTPGTTFYVLAKKELTSGKITFASKDNKILYFKQEVDATTYKNTQVDLTTYDVETYTNGISYYRLNIRDIRETTLTKKYAVNRNHYYKVNITEISNLGFNTAAGTIPTEPTTPLETQTHISADITIEPWTVVDMNEPLG